MEATSSRKIIDMLDPCKKGQHTFIVTVWNTSAGTKKATYMKCQHCLMPIELNSSSQDWVINAEWLTENPIAKA